jgi:hypothetical protein
VLVLAGVALGGVDPQVADAAPRHTPASKIARLRAKAAHVQAAIDRMNARVEGVVEDYNEVREALARTRAEQARTRQQVVGADRAAVDRVDRLRREVEALAARLADQAQRQQRLQAPPGRPAAPDRVPPGRPAPLPQAPDQAGPAGRGPGAPPPGDAPAPGPAPPPGRRAGGAGGGRDYIGAVRPTG